jgi:hypothetical protein
MVNQMTNQFAKALAVVLGGALASCASAQRSASSSNGQTQQALAAQSGTDAALRDGLPVGPVSSAPSSACAMIPESEQSICPVQRTAVQGTSEIREPMNPKGNVWKPAGAIVYMVAAPGLTSQWLGHLIECYQSRVAEAGNALEARQTCPLAELDSSYAIGTTRDGFAVAIHSSHSDAANRIVEVSARLVPSESGRQNALAARP